MVCKNSTGALDGAAALLESSIKPRRAPRPAESVARTEDSPVYRAAAMKPDRPQCVLDAIAWLETRIHDGPLCSSSAEARDLLRLRIAHLEHEVFGVLLLDTRRRMIGIEEMFRGTIDQAIVYPREVVKTALRSNAAALIAYHNHPSGSSEASEADKRLTRMLKDALSLVDVHLLDHMI